MMSDIKKALSFLFGATYASFIWWIVIDVSQGGRNGFMVIPLMGLIFGTLFLLMAICAWLADNWRKE